MSLAQVQNTSADAVNATFAQSIDKLINGIASNIVWAIIIILVGLILGRLLGTFLAKALREIELNAVIEKMTDRTIKLEELIATTSSVIIYFLAIVLALNQVGIAAFVINTLAIGLLVLVLLLILLSLKDTLPNIVAGFTLGYKNLYSVGDEVEVDRVKGKIIYQDILETRVKTHKTNDIIHVPNSYMLKNKLTIRTLKKSPSKKKE